MGHTHEAIMARVATNTTYVNLGAWAVDELAEEASTKSAACTHLVIRHDEAGEPQAEFFTWDADTGVTPLLVKDEVTLQAPPERPSLAA